MDRETRPLEAQMEDEFARLAYQRGMVLTSCVVTAAPKWTWARFFERSPRDDLYAVSIRVRIDGRMHTFSHHKLSPAYEYRRAFYEQSLDRLAEERVAA